MVLSTLLLASAFHQSLLVPHGMLDLLYTSRKFAASKEKPAGLDKVPDGLKNPIYGAFTISPEGNSLKYFVAIDMGAHNGPQVYVDSNGNGDLTDDPVPITGHQIYDNNGEQELTSDATPLISIPYKGREVKLGVKVGITTLHPETRPDPIYLALDYAAWVQLDINGKVHDAWLKDGTMQADFTAQGTDKAGVMLQIDLNDNGRIDSKGETFRTDKPFRIEGQTYRANLIGSLMPQIALEKVQEPAAEEIKPPTVLRINEMMEPFEVKTMDGKTLKFPEDFRGKQLLVDFASSVVHISRKAFPVIKQLKSQLPHLEVLTVFLERPNDPNAKANVQKLVDAEKIDWPVVQDPQSWNSPLPARYAIAFAPTRVLLDGTTGRILVAPQDLQNVPLVENVFRALGKSAPESLRRGSRRRPRAMRSQRSCTPRLLWPSARGKLARERCRSSGLKAAKGCTRSRSARVRRLGAATARRAAQRLATPSRARPRFVPMSSRRRSWEEASGSGPGSTCPTSAAG